MNAKQLQYAQAKAAYDTISEIKAIEMKPFSHLLDNEVTFDEYCEIEIEVERRLGYWIIVDNLHTAEEEMVEWAFSRVSSDPKTAAAFGKNERNLAHLKENGMKLPSVRAKLIDISFSLA